MKKPAKTTNKTAKELYPDYDGGYGPGSYQPMLNDFGNILVQVDDSDYQGDSRILYEKGGKYGILIFGWGSCSGCDALQGCATIEELDELISSLRGGIQWMTKSQMTTYVKEHDWKGDYSWHAEETQQFIEECKEYLGAKKKALK